MRIVVRTSRLACLVHGGWSPLENLSLLNQSGALDTTVLKKCKDTMIRPIPTPPIHWNGKLRYLRTGEVT